MPAKHGAGKSLRRQKDGGDAEESPYCLAETAAADFSLALLMVSYFSLMMVLLSVHVDVK